MTVLTHRRAWRGGALCALACYALALQGCATQHRHDGVHGVEEALAARGLAVTATAGQPIPVPEAKPLSVAEVVGIALSNSPAVQSEYVALALGADEVYAAPPWPTPVFSGEWLDPKFPGTTQRVFGLAVAVGDLITWPARRRISQQHYATLQARVADAVIAAASATAAAYYRHAAALQAHELQRRITTTATLRADLAGRFHAAGNMAARELAEYRASAAQARLAQLDSAREVDATRVVLADTLGVSTREKWQIDRRLALPARAPGQVDGLVKLARDTRLDLDAARIELESAITEGQAIPWANWFGNIEVGYVRDRDTDRTLKRGPSLVVGLPDAGHHGAPALAEAEIEFLRLYYEIENAVALAASDVARGRERVEIYAAELLPQQGAASRGALAQYNFMLTGPFDLLEQKQHELESYRGYIEALRDYWLARVELDRALGVAPAREFDDASWFDIDTPTIGAGSEMDHSQHQMMDHSQHEGMDHSQHEGMRPADPRRPERTEQGDGQ